MSEVPACHPHCLFGWYKEGTSRDSPVALLVQASAGLYMQQQYAAMAGMMPVGDGLLHPVMMGAMGHMGSYHQAVLHSMQCQQAAAMQQAAMHHLAATMQQRV